MVVGSSPTGRTSSTAIAKVANLWLRPDLGNLPLDKITTRRLDQAYDKVTAAGRSPNTVGHVHAVARGALNQAMKWGWIHRSPTVELRAADFGCELEPNGYVFSREPDASAPIRPEWVTKGFAAAAIAADLFVMVPLLDKGGAPLLDKDGAPVLDAGGEPRMRSKPIVRLHDLRHLNATLQLLAGVDPATGAKRLGHAKTSTFLDVYGHGTADAGRQAATCSGNCSAPAADHAASSWQSLNAARQTVRADGSQRLAALCSQR